MILVVITKVEANEEILLKIFMGRCLIKASVELTPITALFLKDMRS